jgi:hypothetical protein
LTFAAAISKLAALGQNMKTRQKKYLLTAMLVALCVVLGYLKYIFIIVPNVELITAGIFISGYLVGPWFGGMVGFSAELIFSVFNPSGTPMLPLLAAQVLSMILVGATGGIIGKYHFFKKISATKIAGAAVAGLLLTLFYDVTTSLAGAVSFVGTDKSKLLTMFLAGMAFYLTHMLSNTIIFAVLVPAVTNRMTRVELI